VPWCWLEEVRHALIEVLLGDLRRNLVEVLVELTRVDLELGESDGLHLAPLILSAFFEVVPNAIEQAVRIIRLAVEAVGVRQLGQGLLIDALEELAVRPGGTLGHVSFLADVAADMRSLRAVDHVGEPHVLLVRLLLNLILADHLL